MPYITLLVNSSLDVLHETTAYTCHEDVWNAAIPLFLARAKENHQYLLIIVDIEKFLSYHRQFRLRGNEVQTPDGYHSLGRVAARYIRGTIRYVERG